MSAEGYIRAKEIFADALEKAEGTERTAWLAQACGDNLELRQAVEALLRAYTEAGKFLEQPAAGALVSGDSPASDQVSIPLTEKPGDTIGPYKLLEQIGEGGCGVVYMAEQAEPIRRKVALKVIKLGMDTKQVVARFEAERQALALMDHPNIARVLDAGATETGRPYFVMELVRGIRITDYCDENSLSTELRLDLFSQVCHAIQHAHQKGIIHRDIKPSNILVTVVDGQAVPKVIDFGIAKATGGQVLTDKTAFTAFQQFIGTPAYMSPEQAVISGVDVDTRSDVYSLGVLLYELLTSHTPFDPITLLAAGLDEMRRVIRETEPAKPSTRLSTLDNAEKTTVARRRQADPPRLIHQVRGDLDWIVMKCLEKERARRYGTASQIALDIEHHLRHEPVTAAAPGAAYRAGKFIRRHQAGLAVAAALVGLLAAAVVISSWQAFRATRAEREKAAEATKSQQVAAFLRDMLEGVGPSVAKGRDTTLLKEILDKTAERVGRDLTNQPEVEAELRATLGNVYGALSDYTNAESMHHKVLQLRQQMHGDRSAETAKAMNNLAMELRNQGRLKDAEAMQRQALAMQKELLGDNDESVAIAMGNLAYVLSDQGVKLEEAMELQQASIGILRQKLGTRNPQFAMALNNLAAMCYRAGKLDQAIQFQKEALELQKELQGSNSADYAQSLNNLSIFLITQGKLAEAEVTIREALATRRAVLGSNHAYVATSLGNLASVLWRQSRLGEAEGYQLEALAIYTNHFGLNHPEVALCLNNLATIIHEQGKYAEAEVIHRQVIGVYTNLYGPESRDLAVILHNLGRVLCDVGRLAEARELHQAALAMHRKILGAEHPHVALGCENLATVFWLEGNLAEAETNHLASLALRRKLFGNQHMDVMHSLNSLGLVLRDQKRLAEAEAAFSEALAGLRKALGNQNPQVSGSLENLALLLLDQGRFAQAEPLARECFALRRAQSTNHWRTGSAQLLLGGALLGMDKLQEADPLIKAGLETMNQPGNQVATDGKRRKKEINDWITRLSQAKGRPVPK